MVSPNDLSKCNESLAHLGELQVSLYNTQYRPLFHGLLI
jgi:hypothetical protein